MNSKKVKGRHFFKIFVLAIGFLLGCFGLINAQDNKNAQDDKAAKVKVSPDEEKAVKKILAAKTLGEKVTMTKEFITKYPQSPARNQAANYLAGQIVESKNDAQIAQNGETYLTIFTEPAEADIILPNLIYAYVALKRYKDAFSAGEKYLARHPEDAAIRLQLAVEGSNLLRTGVKDYAKVSHDYAAQAIELIEANKKPTDISDIQWKDYQTKWLPQLYQSLGMLDFDAGDKAKARINLEKASSLNSSDINSWVLLATMTDDEYQDLAQKYTITSAGATRDELLKQANEKMDQVIEMFARIVALTDGKPEVKQLNDQVRQNLEQYYKYRHKNLDGLNDLIGKYKK